MATNPASRAGTSAPRRPTPSREPHDQHRRLGGADRGAPGPSGQDDPAQQPVVGHHPRGRREGAPQRSGLWAQVDVGVVAHGHERRGGGQDAAQRHRAVGSRHEAHQQGAREARRSAAAEAGRQVGVGQDAPLGTGEVVQHVGRRPVEGRPGPADRGDTGHHRAHADLR